MLLQCTVPAGRCIVCKSTSFGFIKLFTPVNTGSDVTLIVKLVQMSKNLCFSKQAPTCCGPPPDCCERRQVECLKVIVVSKTLWLEI